MQNVAFFTNVDIYSKSYSLPHHVNLLYLISILYSQTKQINTDELSEVIIRDIVINIVFTKLLIQHII